MIQYDVYVGYGGRSNAADSFTELGGFALGLGLHGFTAFDAVGGWESAVGEQVYEPIKVFRFILDVTERVTLPPWPVLVFVSHAKFLLQQEAVLVTQTEVNRWGI